MVIAKRKPTLDASRGRKVCSVMACALCVAGFAFTRALCAAAVVLTPGAAPRRLPFGDHAGSLNVDVAALRRWSTALMSLRIRVPVNGHVAGAIDV